VKATLYRCFDDVLVALFRACTDIEAEHSLNMIGIKKGMFHNSHLFYESLAEGYKSNVAHDYALQFSKVPTPSQD